jgi:hypothetical protein
MMHCFYELVKLFKGMANFSGGAKSRSFQLTQNGQLLKWWGEMIKTVEHKRQPPNKFGG